MTVSFGPIDLNDSRIAGEFQTLVDQQLGGGRTFEEIVQLLDYRSGETMVIGGQSDGRLVCINAFMPQGFERDGQPLRAFQSGFSATHSDFRGQGLWPRMMREAETLLEARGADFLFGFPNPVSYPLFVKKLGYATADTMMRLRVVALPLAANLAFRAPRPTSLPGERIRPVLDQTLAWKQRSSAEPLFLFENALGRVWGKRRIARRAGAAIPYLAIGAFELADRTRVQPLLRAALRDARVLIGQLGINARHSDADLFALRQAGLPAIVKPLGGFALGEPEFDFYEGMFDTF